ncbi:MAG: CDP-alcohol phosphatidyltransferase family protein [Chthoniobacterales bacterium]|nr:CDP-alcohol phosphatidyltransferase family protein [Chthoniobacterales bacterium]
MSKVPAVLVCDGGTGNLEIAGLTVLDRMVVASHRAGCDPITIVAETVPPLACAQALGIRLSVVKGAPAGVRDPGHPTLTITGGVLVESRDLERVIAARGQLVAPDGSPLPIKMNAANPRPVVALGAAHTITDAASAREAERKLWASLGSSADGVVDRFFNRPLGRAVLKLLVHTSISPNAVSIASILIGVGAAPFFVAGDFIVGALLLQLCTIVDCVDGDLARALFKQSQLGKWLDIGGDQVVHVCVFAAIGLGVARANPQVPAIALGASAALGVLICFPVIIRGLRRPPEHRGYLLSKLMDATANRDFTVLLLALAFVGRMDLFVWMAGIGIHLFWIALLALQSAGRVRAAPISRESP